MIDGTVQNLLEKAIDTPTKLHLLLVFHEHPHLEITPTRMAERCCRDIWSVTQALRELAEDGVLVTGVAIGLDEPRYRYMPCVDYIEPIRKLLHGYDDPLEREMLHRSIRDLAAYAPFRRNTVVDFQFAIL